MNNWSLGPKNHPRSPVLRLTLTSSAQIKYSWQTNRWWKLSPCCPKNHPRNPVLPLMLRSSMYIDYCWLRNRWWKLGPWTQKSSKKPSSTADADIFCTNKLLLTDKPLMKTVSLVSQNSSSKRSSTADAEIFNIHRLLLAKKPLKKLGPSDPKNHPRSLVLRLTLTSSA